MPTTQNERGQVLALVAIFMVVLLVSAALAIDFASWLAARREFQSVSDAASVAAAAHLPEPGTQAPTLVEQRAAAADALVYLSDHLGLGIDSATALTIATNDLTVAGKVQRTAPYIPAGSNYCIWIWTPTPIGTEIAGTDATCQPTSGVVLYAPANFPSNKFKVFVRIEAPRQAFFGNIVGLRSELVSALAVAGTARTDYAIIALKPRLGSPDNFFGVTINGGTHVIVPVGDIGGNYTLSWGGSGSQVNFTNGLDQRVVLAEPGTVQGIGTVTNGAIEQLEDYPIEDPGYMIPLPSWCTGAVTVPCREPSPGGTGIPGGWPWPPSSGGPLGTASYRGVYPDCASNQEVIQHTADFGCLAPGVTTATLWPGMYERVNVPAGITLTLSPTCWPGDPANGIGPDTDCINNNRAGIFYFRDANGPSQPGLYLNGPTGSPTAVTGCGVFLMFDPSGNTGSKTQLNTQGNGNTLSINGNACNMHSDPTNPSGTTDFKWYGFNAGDYTNPVSIWVRPNGVGYNITSPNSGSTVINMGAGSAVGENGVIYAPEDNTKVSGGPAGSGVGQIVAWTITYVGGSNITETFQGPGLLRTRLYQ